MCLAALGVPARTPLPGYTLSVQLSLFDGIDSRTTVSATCVGLALFVLGTRRFRAFRPLVLGDLCFPRLGRGGTRLNLSYE